MRLVWIKWVDSKGDFRAWIPLKELRKEKPCVCESVGWLVNEPVETGIAPEDYILAPHLWAEGDGKKPRGADGGIVIPAGAVLDQAELMRCDDGIVEGGRWEEVEESS